MKCKRCGKTFRSISRRFLVCSECETVVVYHDGIILARATFDDIMPDRLRTKDIVVFSIAALITGVLIGKYAPQLFV